MTANSESVCFVTLVAQKKPFEDFTLASLANCDEHF